MSLSSRVLLSLLLGLVLGFIGGYWIGTVRSAASQQPEAEVEPETEVKHNFKDNLVFTGAWPDVPCPPDSTSQSARHVLNQIYTLGLQAAPTNQMAWNAAVLALQCRDVHAIIGANPNHVGAANLVDRSNQVWRAYQAAQAGDWKKCRDELDHPP